MSDKDELARIERILRPILDEYKAVGYPDLKKLLLTLVDLLEFLESVA